MSQQVQVGEVAQVPVESLVALAEEVEEDAQVPVVAELLLVLLGPDVAMVADGC